MSSGGFHTLPPDSQGPHHTHLYLIPGHCGLRVALDDCLELCCVASLCLHILNGDLHGRGPWREEENCEEQSRLHNTATNRSPQCSL